MNILPLILTLVLMLSVLSVAKLENFKSRTVVHHQYQMFLEHNERKVFNDRQKKLCKIYERKSLRQLSFRFLIDKKARDEHPDAAKQYRNLIKELMTIVYGEAAFFKNLESKRSGFLEELLDSIQYAADEAPEKMVRRIQDIAKLDLKDLELQQAFYHMLKGTVEREELENLNLSDAHIKEKAYVSLFRFIHYNLGKNEAPPRIMVQRCPREILKVLFIKDEIVEAILVKRNELAKNDGTENDFKTEFLGKVRKDLDLNTELLLNFKVTKPDTTCYD